MLLGRRHVRGHKAAVPARRDAPEPGSLVEELWLGDMSGPRGAASSRVEEAELRLALPEPREAREGRPSSWSSRSPISSPGPRPPLSPLGLRPRGRVRDARPARPYSACGFLFRYQDEGNFYSVLVSNRGYLPPRRRLQRHPRPLVAWTEMPGERDGEPGDEADSRSASSRGAGTSRSSSTTSGPPRPSTRASTGATSPSPRRTTARAGEPRPGLASDLRSCMVESRPVEVETWYYRWNYYIVPDPEARRRLAETLFAMGESLAAAVQLRKIERRRPLDADELFLKAEAALRLGLQDEAEAALDACLALEPGEDGGRRGEGQPPLPARPLPRAARLPRPHPAARGGTTRGSSASRATPASASATTRARPGSTEPRPTRAGRRERGPEPGPLPHERGARLGPGRAGGPRPPRPTSRPPGSSLPRRPTTTSPSPCGRLSALKAKGDGGQGDQGQGPLPRGQEGRGGEAPGRARRQGAARTRAATTLLGLILAEKGQGEKALERFEAALGLEPDYPLYAFRYAERLFLLGATRGPRSSGPRARRGEGRPPRAEGPRRHRDAGLDPQPRRPGGPGPRRPGRGRGSTSKRRAPPCRGAASPPSTSPTSSRGRASRRRPRRPRRLSRERRLPQPGGQRLRQGRQSSPAPAMTPQAGGRAPRGRGPGIPQGDRASTPPRPSTRPTSPRPTSSSSAIPRPRRGSARPSTQAAGRAPSCSPATSPGLRRPRPSRGRLPPGPRAFERRLARGSDPDAAWPPPRGARPLLPRLGKAAKAESIGRAPRGGSPPSRAAQAPRRDPGGHDRGPLLLDLRPRLAGAPRPARPERLDQGHAPRRLAGRRLPPLRQDLLHRLPQGRARDNRFTCPDCGEALKLSDDRLRYLVRESIRRAGRLRSAFPCAQTIVFLSR